MASQSTSFGEEMPTLLAQGHSCHYSICLFVIMVCVSDRWCIVCHRPVWRHRRPSFFASFKTLTRPLRISTISRGKSCEIRKTVPARERALDSMSSLFLWKLNFAMIAFQILWDGKKDKIKRSEMIADYGDGGQKMLDIIAFNKSLKIAWIVKYTDFRWL